MELTNRRDEDSPVRNFIEANLCRQGITKKVEQKRAQMDRESDNKEDEDGGPQISEQAASSQDCELVIAVSSCR